MKKILASVLAVVLCLSMVAMASADAIKLGFIGPLTGAAAVYGIDANNGAIIAVEEINAAAGEEVIKLISEDDIHDPEVSINAYNTAMNEGVQAFVGCVTSKPCEAVAAIAYEERVFMLTPSASSTKVTADKDNCYQLCFTDPAQGTLSAQYIAQNGLATKVGVIYNNADVYSTGIYQTFVDESAAQNLEVVAVSTFTDETTDFSVQVAEMKNAGAELVFLPIYYTPASMILMQAKATEYAPLFFGVDGMDGILSLEGFDASLAEGVYLLTPFVADALDEITANFVANFNAKFGYTPTQFAADAYDCVYALYKAFQASGMDGASSPEDVCEAMIATFSSADFSITGTTGDMTWSANGEVTKSPKAVIIKDGAYVAPENY